MIQKEQSKDPIFQHKGKRFVILSEFTDVGDEGRAEQLLRDFQYCESVGDWTTIKNRMSAGLMQGWIKEITDE